LVKKLIKKIMKKLRKVVVLTENGFEDEEVIYPIIRLKEAGFDVDIATPGAKLVLGRLNFPLELLVRYYGKLVDAKKLKTQDYVAVLIPGGFEAPDRMRQVGEILDFVRKMNKEKKLVAAFCHGPWVLISSGLLKGKRATGYIGIKDDIVNAGAKFVDEATVSDGNIITSRHPRDVGEFMKVVLKALG